MFVYTAAVNLNAGGNPIEQSAVAESSVEARDNVHCFVHISRLRMTRRSKGAAVCTATRSIGLTPSTTFASVNVATAGADKQLGLGCAPACDQAPRRSTRPCAPLYCADNALDGQNNGIRSSATATAPHLSSIQYSTPAQSQVEPKSCVQVLQK
jgi:hypothetical protein